MRVRACIEKYRAGKSDAKVRAITRYRNQLQFVRDLLGDDVVLAEITRGDGDMS